ncbi:HNH endonuclease [Williamsia sp. Leaf354]|uniref:HNH endonuclease n=1 Tax=Williamsia sp. Leaf354 TaxID=1736349 RepID=UPI0006FBA684|nr:HNH endonuclease signature motif containing protein [Williamsia sp. Leaf354]KQR99435.1 HNH endonuclease [Williamsia sp. Leaf354]
MSVTALASKQSDLFDFAPPDGLSDDELTDRVVGYASQIAALTARFLDLLREFDDRKVWSGIGIRSCAHWLSWKTGMSLRTAQDHLRIAHALTDLPRVSDAFAEGRLSYSKVRAITRVATPDREEELVNAALSATAAQVERLVRGIAHIDRAEDEAASRRIESSSRWKWNDDGSLAVTMRLSPVDGARFLAGVVRSEYERTRTTGDPDLELPADTQHLDVAAASPDLWRGVPTDISGAVVTMADTARTVVAMPDFAPGAEIVIHTDAEHSVDPHLDAGPAIATTEVDEAACGGSTREIGHKRSRSGKRGVALTFGRKRRLPTKALLRVVHARDRGCRHPACGRTRHLHAHHVRFWSHGGTTDPDNLILLCSTHHRALHNGDFTIRALGHQQFTFHHPSGTPIDTAPPTTAPPGWRPNTTIADDALEPIGGGPLDLGYTLEVLYGIWEWRDGQQSAPTAA